MAIYISVIWKVYSHLTNWDIESIPRDGTWMDQNTNLISFLCNEKIPFKILIQTHSISTNFSGYI